MSASTRHSLRLLAAVARRSSWLIVASLCALLALAMTLFSQGVDAHRRGDPLDADKSFVIGAEPLDTSRTGSGRTASATPPCSQRCRSSTSRGAPTGGSGSTRNGS
ncbi:MAG: hypothetical protein WA210_23975 [Burkholderiaceae bacterium]